METSEKVLLGICGAVIIFAIIWGVVFPEWNPIKKAPTPAPDTIPYELLPDQADGITVTKTLPHLTGLSAIGAEDGARGVYTDEWDIKLILEIYKFKFKADAEKIVDSVRNDVLNIYKLEDEEVIVFTKGNFVFVVWGNSSTSVKSLAEATGYY